MKPLSQTVWRLVLRTSFAVALALLLWAFGPFIWHILSPFLIALPVAALLQKPIRWTEKRLRLKHGFAVTIWVVVVCAAIVALLYGALSFIISQVVQLSGNYQAIINDIVGLLRNVSNQIFDALDAVPESVETWARATLNDAFAGIATTATRWLGLIFNWTVNFASSLPYWLIYLNFLLLGIFFLTSDMRKIQDYISSRMGEALRSRSRVLSGSAGQGIAGYVKVQLLYGVLVFAVSWPCLHLFGLPYPGLIALLAALLEFLPVFGNGTLYIPWAVIAYIIGMPTLAISMLILHLALYIFRRLTEPKLMSRQMGLTTLLSLVSMFVGMQVGGVLGLILAPVVVVVVQAAWEGGLFAGTVADLRVLVRHVHGRLYPVEEANEQEP